MNEQEQQIRIAIVYDHEMFRAGVIATLQPHFDIVGQASDVEGSVARRRSRMWCFLMCMFPAARAAAELKFS